MDRAAADSARATGRHAAAAAGRRADVEAPAGAAPTRPAPPVMAAHSHPSGRVARGAIVCFCEDVRAWEIRAEVAAGYADPELVKRRTGALTGPCQGKYCLQSFACLVGDDDHADRPATAPAGPPGRPRRRVRARRPGGRLMARSTLGELLDTGTPPPSADVVIVGAGIAGLAIARELAARGVRDVVIVERGYPGGGATGRNVARIRAMQLTEELTHVALACQAKYDRMGEELGFNVLFYRLGYAWVLYDADEVERMRAIVEMHHRIGVAQPAPVTRRHAPAPADPARRRTRRGRRPQRRRDRPPRCGRLGASRAPGPDERPDRAGHDRPRDRPRAARRRSGRDRPRPHPTRGPSSTPPTAGRASSTPWPASRRRTDRSGARSS